MCGQQWKKQKREPKNIFPATAYSLASVLRFSNLVLLSSCSGSLEMRLLSLFIIVFILPLLLYVTLPISILHASSSPAMCDLPNTVHQCLSTFASHGLWLRRRNRQTHYFRSSFHPLFCHLSPHHGPRHLCLDKFRPPYHFQLPLLDRPLRFPRLRAR